MFLCVGGGVGGGRHNFGYIERSHHGISADEPFQKPYHINIPFLGKTLEWVLIL